MFVYQPKLTPNSQTSFPLFPSASAGFCEEDVEVEAALSWSVLETVEYCRTMPNVLRGSLFYVRLPPSGLRTSERFASKWLLRAALLMGSPEKPATRQDVNIDEHHWTSDRFWTLAFQKFNFPHHISSRTSHQHTHTDTHAHGNN